MKVDLLCNELMVNKTTMRLECTTNSRNFIEYTKPYTVKVLTWRLLIQRNQHLIHVLLHFIRANNSRTRVTATFE